MELALSAMVIAIVLGIPLGLWAGLRPNGIAGRWLKPLPPTEAR